MRYLIYFVSVGDFYHRLTKLAVESIYIGGYTGDVLIASDKEWAHEHAPSDKVKFKLVKWVPDFGAKKLKATIVKDIKHGDYDAIMFLDCDILLRGDITPLLERAAANPDKLYAAHTSNRRLMGTGVGRMQALTKKDKDDYADLPMVDSYCLAFAPTTKNLKLTQDWVQANEHETGQELSYKSDAHGLNWALLKSKRIGDVVFMDECERLNGKPKPHTLVAHYVYGQHVLMPRVFNFEILAPHLEAKQREEQAKRRAARVKKLTEGTK